MDVCKNDGCCKDMAHIMISKHCEECKKEITGFGTACRLCSVCAAKLNQCEHCREVKN